MVPLDYVKLNPEQPRSPIDTDSLTSLAASIEAHGVLSPLLVREESNGRYLLIAGERRWRAAGKAGLTEVPVLVTERAEQARALLVLSLVENLQREDLNPVEEARGYQRLCEEYDLTQEEVGQVMGRDRSTITNALRLLRLPEHALEALHHRQITVGHAKALLSLKDPGHIPGVLEAILNGDLSVRATERLVASLNGTRESVPAPSSLPSVLRRVQEDLIRSLGAAVQVKPRAGGGGSIVIQYSGNEELNALVDRLLGDA